VQMANHNVLQKQQGAIMAEVLVALFFVVVVFMGHIGSQSFMQNSSIEASRRAQAYIVLNDMVERMQSNRQTASCYAFTLGNWPYVGQWGSLPPTCAGAGTAETQLRADQDIAAWHQLLVNGGVTNPDTGQAVGGLKNGRGCISVDTTTNPPTYTISVAWEGSSLQTIAGNNLQPCAMWSYDSEQLRRVISTKVQFGNLKS